MSLVRIQTGDAERIHALILDADNAPVTGATVTATIRRKSDNKYYDGSGGFQPTATAIPLLEVSASESPGEYDYEFVTAGLEADTYYVRVEASSGINVPQLAEIRVGEWVDNIDKKLSDIRLTGGGGFFIGASRLFWSEEEKEEVLTLMRKLTMEVSDMKGSQDEMRESTVRLADGFKDLDRLVTEHRELSEKVAAEMAGTKADLSSVLKKAGLLGERLAESGNQEAAGQIESARKVVMQELVSLRQQLHTVKVQMEGKLQDVTTLLRENAETLDTVFNLNIKGSSTDDLESTLEDLLSPADHHAGGK